VPALGTFFLRCPSCKRRFGVTLVEKRVDAMGEKAARPEVDKVWPSAPSRIPIETEHEVSKSRVVKDVTKVWCRYSCRHCGNQWSTERPKTVSGRVGSEYGGD